jgi:hypothetical protein
MDVEQILLAGCGVRQAWLIVRIELEVRIPRMSHDGREQTF